MSELLYKYYGALAALNAGGSVWAHSDGRPLVAAIGTTVAVATSFEAFRQLANSLTQRLNATTMAITRTIQAETDDLHHEIESVPLTIELRAGQSKPGFNYADIVTRQKPEPAPG